MSEKFKEYNYSREANYHAILEYLIAHPNPKDQSFRKIEKATGIPKSTVAEIISEKGNLRKYPAVYLEKLAKENPREWNRIKDAIKPFDKKGDVQYYGFRSSQFNDFLGYAMRNGYLVKRLRKGLSVTKTDPGFTSKTFYEETCGIEHNPYEEDDWEYWYKPDKINSRKLANLGRGLKTIKKFKIPDEITIEDTFKNPQNYDLVKKHLEQMETKEEVEFILELNSVPEQVDAIFRLMDSKKSATDIEIGKMLFEEWKRINKDEDGSIYYAILDYSWSEYY